MGMIFSLLVATAHAEETEAQRRRKTAEAMIEGYLKKSVSYEPLRDPDNQYALKSVENVRMISMLTGEYSQNETKSRYAVGGTDLGVMMNLGDTTYIAFGDTFLQEDQTEQWRNNVLAFTTDDDYTDGIAFDGMVMNNMGIAKELMKGKKLDKDEMAKIPTGGFVVDDTMYMSYMSVNTWGPNSVWTCNHGGIARSRDQGKTWQYIPSLRWPGDTAFCQMYPVVVGDMVYVPGITGGRFGSAKLMRVPLDEYENFEAYEYLTAVNDKGEPVFEKGQEAMYSAMAIIPPAVGEMSFLYSEYLKEWIVTYRAGTAIYLRTAKEIWGPYSNAVRIVDAVDFDEPYGAFMNPRYVSEDGKKVCFLMSMWAPIYNVAVMEMELVAKWE